MIVNNSSLTRGTLAWQISIKNEERRGADRVNGPRHREVRQVQDVMAVLVKAKKTLVLYPVPVS